LGHRALTAFAEQFPCGVVLLDPEFRVQWASPAFASLLQLEDDPVGMAVLDLLHPDDLAEILPMALAVLGNAETATGAAAQAVELPIRVLTGAGTYAPMSVAGRVCGDDGSTIVTVRPAAERHALNRVLDELSRGAGLDDVLDGLLDLLRAQFGIDEVWVVHDLTGVRTVLGGSTSGRSSGGPELSLLTELREDGCSGEVRHREDHWLAPVLSHTGETLYGVFVLHRPDRAEPKPFDLHVLARTTSLASLAFARAFDDHMLQIAATTDHLTGLLNRGTFELSVAQASIHPDSYPLVLAFVDVDRFKAINDDHGHHVGDAVLQEVARRLQRTVRGGDVAGRLGGDEFGVLAKAVSSADQFESRLARVFDEPVVVDGDPLVVTGSDGDPLVVTGSVGIAVAHSEAEVEDLMRRADAEMYLRKRTRPGTPPRVSANGSLKDPSSTVDLHTGDQQPSQTLR
jgi:diguanylate cyclase (GGDEF)-like protein